MRVQGTSRNIGLLHNRSRPDDGAEIAGRRRMGDLLLGAERFDMLQLWSNPGAGDALLAIAPVSGVLANSWNNAMRYFG